ncbi:MAG TPA: hypothetical protein VHB54_08555 [Mucilaginibacter sp.]|nr:hypothetical protein [Mucilaginibacter sp.]
MSEFPKLSQPALRALHNAGIADLHQLSKLTEKEFSGLHGIGPTAVKALKEAMKAKGLKFAVG